ncbi:MAG: archaetidylserine decarboxylase [Burkholderiales bacterium]
MTIRAALLRLVRQEDINFLLTNRLPRRWVTQFMGWFSRIETPLIRDASMAVWTFFGDLDLSDARRTSFRSMHDCFIRELKPGARPVDPDPSVLASPCDAIVGACGVVADGVVIQAKGFPYRLADLLCDPELEASHRHGAYVTLRLTSGMYHRFHAPHDCRVRRVTYISGDTWNVNPIALKRVERLFCRNERAVIRAEVPGGWGGITLVPVAAILVASIRLHCLEGLLDLKYRGPNQIACDASFAKGDEMGWFEHGSTIIVFAEPGVVLCEGIREGERIRMGQALLRRPRPP